MLDVNVNEYRTEVMLFTLLFIFFLVWSAKLSRYLVHIWKCKKKILVYY